MKDLFSTNSAGYAQFRPGYPDALFRFLYEQLGDFEMAWDVGTGNGQVAAELASRFRKVVATDISETQLAEAARQPNITYRQQGAEEAFAADLSFDLIISAQAIHWFDFKRFYERVYQYLKPEGLFAAVGYGLIEFADAALNHAIRHLYSDVLKDCWDPERSHLDAGYATIPFPFREVSSPEFAISGEWTAKRLCAYLATWSAVHHYKTRYGSDPLQAIEALAESYDPDALHPFRFPLFVRAGHPIT